MPTPSEPNHCNYDPILLTSGLGKTGRAIADRLTVQGYGFCAASRTTPTEFNWRDKSTWPRALKGIKSIYLCFAPDLVLPGSRYCVEDFVKAVEQSGCERLVLLSCRGVEEAEACETIVHQSKLETTVIRSSWFFQNFLQDDFARMISDGALALPSADIEEPYIDVEDVADVIVKVLTEIGHAGKTYEITGSQSLSFRQIAKEMSDAFGRTIQLCDTPHRKFVFDLAGSSAPSDVIWLFDFLFDYILDGRNSRPTNRFFDLMGRQPRGVQEFLASVAAEKLISTA